MYLGAVSFFSKSTQTGKTGKRRKKQNEEGSSLNKIQQIGIGIAAFSLGQLLFIAAEAGTISQIGPIAIRWYGLMFAASFLLGYYLGSKTFEHAGKPQEQPETLFIYLMIGTVLGARLGHVFFYDFDYYIRNLNEIFYFWQGGLASHGAVAGVLLAIYAFTRKYPDSGFLWTADRIAIPFAIGGSFVRIGNFFNSEILGSPTDVSWAVIFVREDMVPRHPAMLYESFLYMVIFVILIFVYRYFRNNPPVGILSGIFMAGIFLARFVIEFAKERQPGFDETLAFLSMGQILSLPLVAVGIWLLAKADWKKGLQERNAVTS
ncbi:MAG: prolipoprotein diacylglyceryl transferase [Bacteroidetes bacterium]|nr:prolipoprotein diacylglyceryl transferase [Bacteroidota bacterium]